MIHTTPQPPLWRLIKTTPPHVYQEERHMIWQTSLPLVLAYVINAFAGMVDTLMVAQIGAVSLSGVALGNMVFFTVSLLLRPLLSTTASLGAHALGAGDAQRMRDIFRNGFWIATVGGLALVALGYGLSYEVLPHMGQDKGVIVEMQSYLDIRLVELFSQFYMYSLMVAYMTTMGHNKIMIHLGVIATALNILLNYLLIYGNWGFPALGVYGAGLATTISQFVVIVICFVYLLNTPVFKDDFRRMMCRMQRFDWHIAKDIITSGGKVTLSTTADHVLFASNSVYAGMLGVAVLTTHQIIASVWQIAFISSLAIGHALVSRVGYHAGKKDTQRAIAVIIQGIFFGIVTALLSVVIVLACQNYIVSWILPHEDPYFEQANLLFIGVIWIVALTFIFDNIVGVMVGASRGFNDGKMLLWGHLVINLSGTALAYILGFVLNYGLAGILLGAVMGILGLCVAHLCRLVYLYKTNTLYYGVKLGDKVDEIG